MGRVTTADKHIQVGCIVVIVKERKNAKRTGLIKGTDHVIITPPEGGVNSHASLWFATKQGKPVQLAFHEYCLTARKVQQQSTQRRRRK